MKASLFLPAFLLAMPGMASELVESVPKQFIGEWNARLADCGTGDNDSALEIKSDHVSYYESDGPTGTKELKFVRTKQIRLM